MARLRTLKPGFFTNELLAEVPPLGRILFEGLWCWADREGRLEDRSKRIKVEILPYDNCNCEQLLKELADRGFILRYEADGRRYIQIVNFAKHQNPHMREVASTIPAPPEHYASTMLSRSESMQNGEHSASTVLCTTQAMPSPVGSGVLSSGSGVLSSEVCVSQQAVVHSEDCEVADRYPTPQQMAEWRARLKALDPSRTPDEIEYAIQSVCEIAEKEPIRSPIPLLVRCIENYRRDRTRKNGSPATGYTDQINQRVIAKARAEGRLK